MVVYLADNRGRCPSQMVSPTYHFGDVLVRVQRPEVNLHNGADPTAITLPHASEARLTSNVPQLWTRMCEDGGKRRRKGNARQRSFIKVHWSL